MKKTKIPASLTIAQAILESAWGESGLTKRGNNLYGNKGTGPAGGDEGCSC
nr:glucosaminidase domain-containing protein [Brevibacillus laterosporus]